MKPKKIFHLGDQHFFQSKKFNEHQYVCDKFYEELEKEKPDLCVMTGDLIDSKLKLGPEQFDLVRSFLINTAEYCPIILILGNHDLNMQNKERLDAISPVIYSAYNEIKNPIHFLKNSGVYNLYDIDWAVWGVLDDQKNPFPSDFQKENFTIGLFHGAVAGCISETGYRMSGISIEEFAQTDITMMSDIHLRQSFRNGEIQYSGAFLQTKTSENPDGTFIQWDWNGKTYKGTEKKLENIYSTIVEFIPADLRSIQLDTFSKDQRILLKYDVELISKVDANEFKKQIEAAYGNEVELKPIIKKKIKLKNDEVEEREVIDIAAYFLEYINKYKEELKLDDFDNDLKRILKHEEEYGANLDLSKDFELGDFSLQNMTVNNILSYGPKDMFIDLSMEGIVGINAPNRTGKSNIFKALQFALYNSSPNTSSLKKMINTRNRTKPAFVDLYLTKNKRFYNIKRTITPKKASDGVTTVLEFREVDETGNEISNLVGEKRQDTEKEIQKLFGLESMFEILSMFSAQKKQTEFIDCKNAERLTLVNRFLGLQSFELKEKAVMEDLKKDKAVLVALTKEFNKNINLTELEEKKEELINSIEVTEKKQIELQKSLDDYIESNLGLLEMYEEANFLSQKKVLSPDDIAEQKKEIEVKIEKVKSDLAIDQNLLDKETEKLKAVKDLFLQEFKTELASFIPDYKITKKAEQEVAVIYADLGRYKKQLKIDICSTCNKAFEEKDKKKIEVLVEKHEKRLLVLEKEVEDITSVLDAKVEKQNEYNKIGRLVSNLQNNLLSHKNNLERFEANKEKIVQNDDEYKKVQKAKASLVKLLPVINEYKKGLSDTQAEINDDKYTIKEAKRKLIETREEIEDYKLKVEELREIEDGIRVLKAYKDIIHKDGLPLYILKTKMGSVNRQINLIVSEIFPFELAFVVDEDAGELNVNFVYDTEESNDVALASGAETFIINLCIKVGLSQISELPKMSSLLIDEGYGTLDKETIEKIPALFSVLTDYYKNIITVSHLDEVKDMCNHQIRLKKIGNYTEVI